MHVRVHVTVAFINKYKYNEYCLYKSSCVPPTLHPFLTKKSVACSIWNAPHNRLDPNPLYVSFVPALFIEKNVILKVEEG